MSDRRLNISEVKKEKADQNRKLLLTEMAQNLLKNDVNPCRPKIKTRNIITEDIPPTVDYQDLFDCAIEERGLQEEAWNQENHEDELYWPEDADHADQQWIADKTEAISNEELNNEFMDREDDEDYDGNLIYHLTEPSYEGEFNLMEEIYSFYTAKKLFNSNKIVLDDEFLTENKLYTKQQLSRVLNDVSIKYSIRDVALNEILLSLKALIPEVNWPIKTTTQGNIKSCVNDYCEDDIRMMEYHVCPDKGCCAFVANYSLHVICSKCGAHRFRKCTHQDCRLKLYNECTHTLKNRISNKSIFYRPITILLCSLLETEGFLTALSFHFKDKTESYQYLDCSDGSTWKTNTNEMIQNYENRHPFDNNLTIRPKNIIILLGQFYDGCAVYKKKYSVFWPLNIIFLNLPPPYRIKLGAGMFLLSVFTGVLQSSSDDFFLRSLVVGELKALNKGMLLTANGVVYFVQVRMILTILDTIAVSDLLHVQTNQSLCGCPICKHGKGYNRKLKRIVYIGHRKMLTLSHWLRNFGQTQKCCTQNYYQHPYADDFENVDFYCESNNNNINNNNNNNNYYWIETNLNIIEKDNISNDANFKFDKKNIKYSPKRFNIFTNKIKQDALNICDKKNSKRLWKFLDKHDSEIHWIWHHKESEFDKNIFKDDLHYHNCDYRPYEHYTRKTNNEYVEYGKQSIEKQKKNPKLKEKHVNGVKGVWAMDELSYCNIETDLNWGPMHCLCNISMNLIKNWKRTRITKSTKDIIRFCKSTGTHPELYFINTDENKIKKTKKAKTNKTNFMDDEDSIDDEIVEKIIIINKNDEQNKGPTKEASLKLKCKWEIHNAQQEKVNYIYYIITIISLFLLK
jgi:hypothetical protein